MATSEGEPPPRTVLLIDDDAGCREALKETLEDEGYLVRVARHGGEGLALLPSCPRPCVVLLDLLMPTTDGWAFLTRLREHEAGRDLPVVVFTAWNVLEVPVGAQRLLRKPIDVD